MMLFQALGLITVIYILESSATGWPAGTYGLPKPLSRCPWADGFRWKTGWRRQDTNYHDDSKCSNNSRSPEFHLDGKVDKFLVNRSFCIKDDSTNDKNRPVWPPGKYCIYRKHERCPEGLKSGYIFWNDDNESLWNRNAKDGRLPDGRYDYYTEIKFCCRNDGDTNYPIDLPFKSPFFLLAYESATCQMVKWAVASLEWIYYFTNDWNNGDARGGAFPYNGGKMHPTIYYCYYQGCNNVLTAINGTFHSPNYPRNYPDGQYCSWRITGNKTQRIHLTFTAFHLEKERATDEVYVYDGKDTAALALLGVFYGGHVPPKEGLYSDSSSLFIIFKSDKSVSFSGFSASYRAVDRSALSVSSTTPQVISPPFVGSTTKAFQNTPSSYVPATTAEALSVSTAIPQVVLSPVVGYSTKTILRTPSSFVPTTTAEDTQPSTLITTMIPQTPQDASSFTIRTKTRGTLYVSPLSNILVTRQQTFEATSPSTVGVAAQETSKGTLSLQLVTPETLNMVKKTTPFTASWRTTEGPSNKGFNMVAVVVPVSFVLLVGLLVGVFFSWKRKRMNRAVQLDDTLCLRLNAESTATDENTEL